MADRRSERASPSPTPPTSMPPEIATSSSTRSTPGLAPTRALSLAKLFTAGGVGEGPLPLFSATPDLFGACISRYGTDFSAQETLLLFGVLLARQAGDAIEPEMVAQRLRSLRNVTAAFLDRDRYMSSYVASTEKLILDRQPRRPRRLPRRLGGRRGAQVAIH